MGGSGRVLSERRLYPYPHKKLGSEKKKGERVTVLRWTCAPGLKQTYSLSFSLKQAPQSFKGRGLELLKCFILIHILSPFYFACLELLFLSSFTIFPHFILYV